jgi:hypothetical protein
MASAGPGSTTHLYGELFKMMAGLDMIHVPYRSETLYLADLIGGQVQVAFDPIVNSIEHIRTGRLRALAVKTTNRSELLPDVPAIGEFLPGYTASAWHGVFDELGHSVKDIEFLTDPTAGEVRIASLEALHTGFLPAVIDRLSRKFPRLTFHVLSIPVPGTWNGRYGIFDAHHPGFAPENLTILAHFSVSSPMNLANSAGEVAYV